MLKRIAALTLAMLGVLSPALADPNPYGYTYSVATAGITVPALPTDMACFEANASYAQIMRVTVNGHAAVAAVASVLLIKRSTVDTGGTPTTFTGVPRYSLGTPAAGANLKAYTVVPTPLGTTVGTIDEEDALIVPGGSSTGGNPARFDFTKGAPLVVYGTEALCIAASSTASSFAGATLEVTIEWQQKP
jgi:hypothetical protein